MDARQPPVSLFKYYSPSSVEKAIRGNYIKWELPCNQNDPFEATPGGYDPKDVPLWCCAEGIEQVSVADLAFLDKTRDWRKFKRDVSHVAAFVSFSERNDSILMWSHYGKEHKGACIEFAASKLERTIDKLFRVSYATEEGAKRPNAPLPHNEQGDQDPDYQNRVHEFLSFKAKEWDYEREWRLIVPPMADVIRVEKSDDRYILVSDIPKGSVKRLIFGCNMPVADRLVLAQMVSKRHPGCLFAEAFPNHTRFKIDIVDLEIDARLAAEAADGRRPASPPSGSLPNGQ